MPRSALNILAKCFCSRVDRDYAYVLLKTYFSKRKNVIKYFFRSVPAVSGWDAFWTEHKATKIKVVSHHLFQYLLVANVPTMLVSQSCTNCATSKENKVNNLTPSVLTPSWFPRGGFYIC